MFYCNMTIAMIFLKKYCIIHNIAHDLFREMFKCGILKHFCQHSFTPALDSGNIYNL